MIPAYAKEPNAALKTTVSKAAALKPLRHHSQSTDPLVFADIYQEDINIVTWKRDLSLSLQNAINSLLIAKLDLQLSVAVTPKTVSTRLRDAFGSNEQSELVDNIAELVDIFCYLLETSQTGLRLNALDRAMCPKFHVDRVPCRLVTTYQGIATQWLPHNVVDRTKLGLGSKGLADNESGIYQHHDDIQQIDCGDVAILKGETWINNENAGLVHRSPALAEGEKRLLLTLDLID